MFLNTTLYHIVLTVIMCQLIRELKKIILALVRLGWEDGEFEGQFVLLSETMCQTKRSDFRPKVKRQRG